LTSDFLDIYVFEGHDFHLFDEPVSSIDVPNPDILHVQLEVEIGLSIDALELNVVAEVKTSLCLNDLAKHLHYVAVFAVEAELRVAVVVFEVVFVHFSLSLSPDNRTKFPCC